MGKRSLTAPLSVQDICPHRVLLKCTPGGGDKQAGLSDMSLSQGGQPGPPHTYEWLLLAMLPSPLSDKINRVWQGAALESCQSSMNERFEFKKPRGPGYQGQVAA